MWPSRWRIHRRQVLTRLLSEHIFILNQYHGHFHQESLPILQVIHKTIVLLQVIKIYFIHRWCLVQISFELIICGPHPWVLNQHAMISLLAHAVFLLVNLSTLGVKLTVSLDLAISFFEFTLNLTPVGFNR